MNLGSAKFFRVELTMMTLSFCYRAFVRQFFSNI